MGVVVGLSRIERVERVFVSTYYRRHFERRHFEGQSDVVPTEPSPLRGYLTTAEEARILSTGPMVFWGGGVDLQDSGSRLKMVLLLIRILLLKRRGSAFVLSFQGAGPVTTRSGRALLRLICRRLDFAVVREPTAYNLLQPFVDRARLSLASDGALLLENTEPEFGRRLMREKGFDPEKPILGINVRKWFHQQAGWLPTAFRESRKSQETNPETRALVNNLASALAALPQIDQIALLPMYQSGVEAWENDDLLLQEVASLLPSRIKTEIVSEDLDPFQLVSVFGALRAVVGVRLHSTILAHVAGTPALHIYYEHKGREHFERLGMADHLVDIDAAIGDDGATLIERHLRELLAADESIRCQLRERVSAIRSDAQAELERIVETLAEPSATDR